MLAALFNVPRWLVALVALCVLAGHAEQVHCKLGGCKPAVAAAQHDAGTGTSESTPDKENSHDCQCQCHLTTLVFGTVALFRVGHPGGTETVAIAWTGRAPEAPCADIEHPPQLA